jgi:type II secretory ATPase GspE/PulE/Tfp pilus assembly ATPase PilB-like protein
MYRLPAAFSNALISRFKVVSELDISERRRPQDGKLRLQAGDSTIELRVAVLPTVNGESAVLRILARSKPLPLAELGISGPNLARLQHIIEGHIDLVQLRKMVVT